jgi:glycosyltransferase involved in cell wall biosynthesis
MNAPRPTIAQLGPAHPNRGGIVHFNNRLALALRERPDLRVRQYFWSKPYPEFLLPGPASEWLDHHSRQPLQVPGKRILSYTNPLSWWAFLRRIRRDRCDILVTHWAHPVHFPVFAALFTAIRLFTHIRIHLIAHNVMPHEKVIGAAWMARTVMSLAHVVVVHSSAERDVATRHLKIVGKVRKSFHPVYDFFNTTEKLERLRDTLNLENHVFLFFGFIRPYKGIDCLVDAFEMLQQKRTDVSLLIVGKNMYKNKPARDRGSDNVTQRIDANEKIIHIDEYVPNEDVGSYFSIADALVAPYHEASQSGPVQIAHALGKPVIASDLPAFRECLEQGVSGRLFKAGDPEALAEAMNSLLRQPPDFENMKPHGPRMGWERYVEILLDDVTI